MNTLGQIITLLRHHPDMGYPEIGVVVGCSRQRVHYIAKVAGLTRDDKFRWYRSDITVERVLELYHHGLLIKEIKQELGCNMHTVRRRLRAAGISKGECCSRAKKLAWKGRSSRIPVVVGIGQ